MAAAARYVYFLSGHIRMIPRGEEPVYNLPFDHIVRAEQPITSPAELEELITGQVTADIRVQLIGQALADELDEVIVRTVSLLHTILVDADDPDNSPVRVLS